jgi:hypothetical protein
MPRTLTVLPAVSEPRGTISAGSNGVEVFNVATFAGGISNFGRITAGSDGPFVVNVSTFAAGINNRGAINAGLGGIVIGANTTGSVQGVSAFTGSIVNVGTVVAKTGLSILDSTIQGALVDSGTIRATSTHFSSWVSHDSRSG